MKTSKQINDEALVQSIRLRGGLPLDAEHNLIPTGRVIVDTFEQEKAHALAEQERLQGDEVDEAVHDARRDGYDDGYEDARRQLTDSFRDYAADVIHGYEQEEKISPEVACEIHNSLMDFH